MLQVRPNGDKIYVVDTSVLVSAPDALHRLTDGNTLVIPFPVLQELDRRRADTSGVGYTARPHGKPFAFSTSCRRDDSQY